MKSGPGSSTLPRFLFASLQKLKEKRKQASQGTVVWQHAPFTNPARGDSLVLRHWVKAFRDNAGATRLADPGPYHFAKYNKKVWRVLRAGGNE